MLDTGQPPAIKAKPLIKACFYLSNEDALDEFWSFMMRGEGITKSVEFIMHICSEVLYETEEEIMVELGLFRYASNFTVKSSLFAKKTPKHHSKVKAFLSIEIIGDVVRIKAPRKDDVINCDFCKAIQDDDPKLCVGLAKEKQRDICPANIELFSSTKEILNSLSDIDKSGDVSILYPLSLRLFIYSKKLSFFEETKELAGSLEALSFRLQAFSQKGYSEAKGAIKLCETAIRGVKTIITQKPLSLLT